MFGLDRVFRHVAQLTDHLLKVLLQPRIRIAVQRQSAAKPAFRKIEHIVDQTRHTHCAFADIINVAQRFLIWPSTQQYVDARIY